ncbi:MAG: diacylglycerol kinase family lipid kinase [Bacteroidota bacterium]|nr:diacylglycerol kinase family lipid kinase [Bacteroidota bacterium]
MLKNLKKYHFILNPVAGRGRAYLAIKKIRNILRDLRVNHYISITNAPKHATELARATCNEHDVVVAVGGDGTINEVMNGLVDGKAIMGILPLGSGNDFAKAIRMPKRIHEAIDIILRHEKKTIDIGKVKTNKYLNNQLNLSEERYFVNGIGIGFDASVAFESSKIRFLRGLPLYITALIKALLKYRTPDFKIKIDELKSKSRYFLIAIGNGISAGGGFYLTPNARLDDNKFDVCYVDHVNLLEIIKIFPSVLKGLHGKYKKVHFTQANDIVVDSNDKFYVHADGEIVGKLVNNVEISMIPNALQVIIG